MYTNSIQTLGQAVDCIQSLPVFEQKQVFEFLDSLISKNKTVPKEQDNLSELQKSFLEWEKFHQKSVAQYDENEMTDEEFDELMASLKDRNDTGREVSFE